MMQSFPLQRMWSDGLCDCFNDCGTCLIAFFFPPYLFARISEKTGDGSFNLAFVKYFIPWLGVVVLGALGGRGSALGIVALVCNVIMAIFGTLLRGHLRRKFEIPGDTCEDFFTQCCCEPCAISQEARHTNRWLMSQNQAPQQQMMQGTGSPMMAPGSPSVQGQTYPGGPVTHPGQTHPSVAVAVPMSGTTGSN
jgi:Cys-rich protein (TIGR01571 family)